MQEGGRLSDKWEIPLSFKGHLSNQVETSDLPPEKYASEKLVFLTKEHKNETTDYWDLAASRGLDVYIQPLTASP